MYRRQKPASRVRVSRHPNTFTPRLDHLEDRLPPGDAFFSWLLTLPGAAPAGLTPPAQTSSSPSARFLTGELGAPSELRLIGQPLTTAPDTSSISAPTSDNSAVESGALLVSAFSTDLSAAPQLGLWAASQPAAAGPGTDGFGLPAGVAQAQDANSAFAALTGSATSQAVTEGMASIPRAAQPEQPASTAPSSSPTPPADVCNYGPDITPPEGAQPIVWHGTTMCGMPNEVLAGFSGVAGAGRDQVAAIEARVQAAGFDPVDTRYLGMDGAFRFRFSPEMTYEQVERTLSTVEGFQYVEPNGIVTIQRTPNDTRYGELYGMHNTGQSGGTPDADIDAPEAWDVATGSTRVVIGNIDTGIDYDHPDLYRNIFINQSEIPQSRMQNLTDVDGDTFISFRDLNDPVNQGPFKITDLNADGKISGTDVLRPMDMSGGTDLGTGGWRNNVSERGDTEHPDDILGWTIGRTPGWDVRDANQHGSHTSGTMGAVGNNNLGVVGVNWDVLIFSVNLFPTGGASWENTVLGVNYLTDIKVRWNQPIKLSNNSWGGVQSNPPTPPQGALRDAVARSGTEGNMLFVAAAGNGNTNIDVNRFIPAGYADELPNILSVAATDRRDLRASFSNWGRTRVHLGAPGVDTLSTTPNGNYGLLSGTSMATPHVTGAAALAWSMSPGATWQQIKDNILQSVDPNNALRVDGPNPVATGGRLNVQRLLARMGFQVQSTTPADGEVITNQATTYVVNFTHPYEPGTVDASDLTVNSVPADSVAQTDEDTLTFTYNTSPVTAEGQQQMNVAQGAVEARADIPLPDRQVRAFAGRFRYDATPLVVTSTVPANGSSIELPFTTLRVNFNEPIDPASVGVNDVTLARGRVVGATAVGSTAAEYTLDGVSVEGNLAVSMAANAVTDAFGNPSQAYSGNFIIDIGYAFLPEVSRSRAPRGSMVYDTSEVGVIGEAGDVDIFLAYLDPGQTVGMVVTPTTPAGVQPGVVVLAFSATDVALVGFGEAAGPNQAAVMPAVRTPDEIAGDPAGPLFYLAIVYGANNTTGGYRVQLTLNADAELEANNGASNDTIATAQNLANAFRALPGSVADRGAVIGRSDAAGAFDYYRVDLGASQMLSAGVRQLGGSAMTLAILDAAGNVLASGDTSYSLVDQALDTFIAPTAGDYYLRVGGTGAPAEYNLVIGRDTDLDFGRASLTGGWPIFSTAPDGRQYVLGHVGQGGGGGSVRVGYFTDFNPASNGPLAAIQQAGYTPVRINDIATIDLSTIDILMVDEANNGGLTAPLSARLPAIQTWVEGGGIFMVHDRFVAPTTTPFANPFFVGAPGTRATRDFAFQADLDVVPPGDTLVINGPHGVINNTSLDNGTSSNHGFVVGATLPAGATSILSAGPNSSNVAAFSYSLGNGAVYYSTIPLDYYLDQSGTGQPGLNLRTIYTPNMLTYGASLVSTTDVYQVTAAAGATLTLRTTTPADGVGSYANILDPMVILYDSNRNEVARNDNGGPDGRNALVNYMVPGGAGGTYYVEVTASDVAATPNLGEYVLSVEGSGGGFQDGRQPVGQPLSGQSQAGQDERTDIGFAPARNGAALLLLTSQPGAVTTFAPLGTGRTSTPRPATPAVAATLQRMVTAISPAVVATDRVFAENHDADFGLWDVI